MSDSITRYELPPAGITLLGYVVRRMHKTRWLMSIPELIAAGKTEQALANIAMYAVTSSTSFGRAYYQPQFNSTGAEISEPDPLTGANVTAKLISTSPHYLITYTATMPNGDIFSGSEEITGTTVGLRGLGMPAPKSDAVLSRLISFNIRVTWTEAELDAYLDKVEGAVRKVMEGVVV